MKTRDILNYDKRYGVYEVEELLLKFAKYHVKAALKAAAEAATMDEKEIAFTGVRAGGSYYVMEINKNSILKAYPRKNIRK